MSEQMTQQGDPELLRRRLSGREKAAHSLRMAFWELPPAEGTGSWSAEMRLMCGFDEATPASREVLLAVAHPDDSEALRHLLDSLLEGPDESRVLIHRIIRPRTELGTKSIGELRRIQSSVVVERDASGMPVRLYGASLDRTEEFQAKADALEKTQELREIEHTFREFAALLPALFWMRDLERRLIYADEKWEGLLGRPIEIGADAKQLLAVVHPDDREQISELSSDDALGGLDAVVRLLDPQGATRWFHLRTIPIPDLNGRIHRVAGIGEDITAQMLTAQSLRDSEARYRSVVLAMTEGIVVHGPDGDIVTTNPSAERVLGLTTDQMMGRTSLDPRWRATHEDGSPFPGHEHPGWVTLKTGESFTGVIMGVHKPEGELRWISVNSRRVTEPGEQGAYSVVASFTDITERRVAKEQLQASLREKEILLREIHHRVKNNLQIVSSLLYLQSTGVDPASTDVLLASRSRIASMALIHQMLYESHDLSRIPFGSYVLDLGRSLARSHGVSAARVKLLVEAGDHILTIGSAIPCGLLLNEILSNSFKHAFPGERSGTIRFELSIDGDGDGDGDEFQMVVSDDGVGLPHDFEERRSTSLGSKLIERLVVQIDGTIRRSDPGQATRYEIRFPRSDESAQP